MTVRTLIDDINTLVPDLKLIYNSTLHKDFNRALRTLYYDRLIEKSICLAHRPIKPTVYKEKILCEKGTELVLPLEGKAYSMRIHGNGRYCIDDGGVLTVRSVDSPNGSQVVRGFISVGGTITFWGNFSFTIYDFSVFSEISSEYPEDIPDGSPKKVFDLRRIYGDFLSFTTPPTDSNGKLITCCRLFNGQVEIDSSFEGQIFLNYRRLPDYIDDDEDSPIDIPAEYELIFPYIVIYYVMIGVDETLANHFKSMYDQHVEHISKNSIDRLSYQYPDIIGWA